jgi:trk system potassium uptake protein TrkA
MKVIVIGCGRMGAGLAQVLTLDGHTVTVVDKDPAAFERLGPNFKGHTVEGIGFDRGVLILAGVERADALAAVTASDEANVVAARLASQVFRVPRVVARLYDPGKAEAYRRLGLQTIAPVTWGVHRMADLLLYSPLSTIVSLGSGEVDVVEVEAPPVLVGRMVKDLNIPGDVQVVAVTRHGKTFMPTLGTLFQQGDLLHLAVTDTSAQRVKEMLGLN